ncbi:MAG TPA: ribosome biogenesis GTPase Der, partial [Ruminococcaceae bacterium]|nr:ribosome biogenesis GTPase Der [Oscillospiraceae bacterium]
IVFISVKTGQRLGELFEAAGEAARSGSKRISTGTLNDMLAQAAARVQPPTDKGRRLKIYYLTQTGIKPPTFVFFVNSAELFHFSYRRYLENTIRETFGFTGTPI